MSRNETLLRNRTLRSQQGMGRRFVGGHFSRIYTLGLHISQQKLISFLANFHDKQMLCPICLDECTRATTLTCGHNVCLACLAELYKRVDRIFYKCPVCRAVNVYVGTSVENLREWLLESTITDDEMLGGIRFMQQLCRPLNRHNTEQDGSLITCAAQLNRIKSLHALVEAGINVNETDNENTPLFYSCAYPANCAIAMFLLHGNANVNATNSNGLTPLFVASMHGGGDSDILRVLIDANADIDMCTKNRQTALMAAVKDGNTNTVKQLIEAGANVKCADKDGMTALHFACIGMYNANDDIVRALIDANADLDLYTNDREVALMAAVQNGRTRKVELLINAGANVHCLDKDGMTALDCACMQDHVNIVTHLLVANANNCTNTTTGGHPLYCAALYGSQMCLRLLMRHSTQVDADTVDGWTPLMISSQHGFFRCVHDLLRARANPNLTADHPAEGSGWTSLMAASVKGHAICVRMLLRAKASVNAQCNDGRTALFIACGNGDTRCCKYLLSAGADANIEHKYTHTTSWQVADKACTRLLRKHL